MWSCDDFATTRFAPKFCRKAAEHIGVPVEQILLLDDNYATGKTAKTDEMLVCNVHNDSSKEYQLGIFTRLTGVLPSKLGVVVSLAV
jgi:beta-phosphoglucomutase-like phosphatase (HAD superfamily)